MVCEIFLVQPGSSALASSCFASRPQDLGLAGPGNKMKRKENCKVNSGQQKRKHKDYRDDKLGKGKAGKAALIRAPVNIIKEPLP